MIQNRNRTLFPRVIKLFKDKELDQYTQFLFISQWFQNKIKILAYQRNPFVNLKGIILVQLRLQNDKRFLLYKLIRNPKMIWLIDVKRLI